MPSEELITPEQQAALRESRSKAEEAFREKDAQEMAHQLKQMTSILTTRGQIGSQKAPTEASLTPICTEALAFRQLIEQVGGRAIDFEVPLGDDQSSINITVLNDSDDPVAIAPDSECNQMILDIWDQTFPEEKKIADLTVGIENLRISLFTGDTAYFTSGMSLINKALTGNEGEITLEGTKIIKPEQMISLVRKKLESQETVRIVLSDGKTVVEIRKDPLQKAPQNQLAINLVTEDSQAHSLWDEASAIANSHEFTLDGDTVHVPEDSTVTSQ